MTRRPRNLATGARPSTLEAKAFRGQTAQILALLMTKRRLPNPWVSSSELAEIGLQYNARIFSLREAGYVIESRVEKRDGKKFGFYRVVSLPGEAAQQMLPLGDKEASL